MQKNRKNTARLAIIPNMIQKSVLPALPSQVCQNRFLKHVWYSLFLMGILGNVPLCADVSEGCLAECTLENTDDLPTVPQYQKGIIRRCDSLPAEHLDSASDSYLEGYIQALVDVHYYEFKVIVAVSGSTVYLYNLPDNALLAKSIIAFVQDLPDVECVEIRTALPKAELEAKEEFMEKPRVAGIWFPQSTVLFLPLIADPRQPVNSINYRWHDKVAGKNAAAVSLGDDFPFFRWRNIFRWRGDLQIGIEAGIWALFDFSQKPTHTQGDCTLVNTDYFVGLPLTYAFDKWSFRARCYHISSHLGDEFLVENPQWIDMRTNPSFEAVDFFTSYQFTSGFRAYFGPGYIFHSDESFKLKPLYVEYGIEWRFWGKRLDYHRLYGTPFIAINLENWEQHHWDLDTTIKAGYELSKLQGVGRKTRFYVDWHHGFSYEGQFFNERVSYGEVGVSWGF